MTGKNAFRRLLTRPLLWGLIYGALIVYGIYALWRIPLEVLPRFNFPQISIMTHEPGATATELESEIAFPLEGQVMALTNLVSVRSSMGNGLVETNIRFRSGTKPVLDLMAVNGAIDRARAQMPPTVHPFAAIMGMGINEVADYSLSIPAQVAPAEAEREVMTDVVPALRALPGVFRVEVYGVGREALWVQPDLAQMYRYGVPISSLVGALQQQVALDPGGYLRQGHQDLFVELRSLPTRIDALDRIPVAGPNGPIPLNQLARVIRASVPTLNKALLDGQPSVALIVFKQPAASTIPVDENVARTLSNTVRELPPGVRWVRIYSQGHLVHSVGEDLGRNLILGGVLAILALFWILGAGRGIWVLALTIPLSILLAVACLYAVGGTLNLMTLGALTIAVGLLSDDGIIVLESIYRRWEQGEEHWPGIVGGVRDIAAPDVSGTLTTVAVFVPLLFVSGIAGIFFTPFAQAMAFSLLASLLISVSLIPLSLGFLKASARSTPTIAGRGLEWLRRHNERLLWIVARRPWTSVAVCALLLAGSLAGLGLVPIDFLPLPNEGVLLESFSLPPGSSILDTEHAVRSMTRRMEADPAVERVFARIGSASTAYDEPAYAGEIQIVLKPSVKVNSLNSVSRRILKETQTPGVQLSIDTPTIERVGESLSGLPQPFVIEVHGSSIRELSKLSREMVQRLRPISSLRGIFNNDGYLITQLQITPRPNALIARHLTPAALFAQVRPLLAGEVVAEVPDGNLPLALYVRLAGAPDRTIAELTKLPVRTDGWTTLGQLANIRMVSTPDQIEHIEGARALVILATPTGPLGNAIVAARKALAGLKLPPGYRFGFGGLYPQLELAALGLGAAALAALVIILGILALQFEGLLVPGLVLIEIPLAFTGGAAALVISGVGLNAIGLVAFLTLIGICLNHGITLLYYARRNEAAGMTLEVAVREAVRVRFRPIALTALTAVLGMLPTAVGWGQGAAPEQGLAIVILGGVLWSALLSTNLLPALYLRVRRHQITKEVKA